MPLVRVEVRNEYGLGAPELYTEANKEDPKAVLEGVAVAGLVGILRQLGDLSEFAAEVFHGLQEQVMITSSRSHKLMGRVQRIEAALPRLEKLVLAQRSHVHFAYTSGANWHSRLRCEQSHFVYSDLPRFIMDSYEHCRGPPHLNLLDKFDPGGPGSCLKRYSDPSFFKRASSGSDGAYIDRVLKEKKGRKIKKKRSMLKTGEVSRGTSFSNNSSRMQFASQNTDGQISPFQTVSNYGAAKSERSISLDSRYWSGDFDGLSRPSYSMHDEEPVYNGSPLSPATMQRNDSNYGVSKSDLGDQSMSLGSRYWSGDLEGLSRSSYSMHDEGQAYNESSSFPTRMHHSDSNNFVAVDGKAAVVDDSRGSLSGELAGPSSFSATWDGKTEKLEPVGTEYDHDETVRTLSMNFDLVTEERGAINPENPKEYDHDENLEALSTNVHGETGRGASDFKTAEEYGYDDTLDAHPTDFNIKTEERRTSHLRPANRYDQDDSLDTLSGKFDGETEERVVVDFETAKDHDYAGTVETYSMKFDVETQDKESSHLRAAKNYDHNANLEACSMNVGIEERGAVQFKAAKEYCFADTSETHPTEFGLKTVDRAISDPGAAKGYDHDETLETHSITFDLESEDRDDIHWKTAGQMDIHPDNKEFLIPVSCNIQFDGSKIEAVGQMNAKVGNEDVPIQAFSNLQRDDIESETDNYVDALNSIESESETDADGANKQEMEQYSDSDNKAVDDGLDMFTNGHSGSQSSDSESVGTTRCLPSNGTLGIDVYEADADGLKKQEVEQYSDSDNKAADDGLDMFTTGHSGSQSSNSESVVTTSCSSSNGTLGIDVYPQLSENCSGDTVISDGIINSVPLESRSLVQSSPIASKSADSGSPPDAGSSEISDIPGSSNMTSVASNMSSDSKNQSSGFRACDEVTGSFSELPKLCPEPSSVPPATFWTNGGLLGLQPSKPPDFSVPTLSSKVEKSQDDRIGASTLKSDVTEGRSGSVDEAAVPECSAPCQDERRGGILIKKASWLFSSADLGVNLQKLSDPCNQSHVDTSQHNGNRETYGTVVPVSPHTASTRGSLEKSSNSSRMFELGNKLLVNGFHRKPSLKKDDNSNSISSPSAIVSELKSGSQNVDVRLFSGRSKDMLSSISPHVSPPSSPPLGHMKISFQPINGFEDHKLQLKFPDGNVSNGSGGNMFPSFQLVPEPSIPLHDAGSDSEDDTFCRSSPYGSDCLSRRSDSNSEQWESSESPSSKEPELYDALCRISFNDSGPISGNTGSAVQGEVNNNFRPQIPLARSSVEHSQSDHLFDLPILDTHHPSFVERNNCDVNSLTEPQCYKEPNPSPPPLPPPQWRAMKLQAEIADDRQVVSYENLSYAFENKFGSTISQHPKPAPLKQEQIIEAAHTMKSKQPDLQKTTRQKEVNQAVLGKEFEENDFLHQIRTKSFNLRRTVTAKPTAASVPPTSSIQVTALLKKANEIRQAVGSDGEDDNWSDT